MADTLGEFALAVEAFSLAHFFGACLEFVNEPLHLGQTTSLVFGHGLAELLEAELHVVEVLDGFAQLCGDVGEHCLEVAEGFAYDVGAFGCHCGLANGIGDEPHHAPVLFAIEVVVLAVLGGYEAEHFALKICHAIGLVFGADVVGHGHDVVHQHIHVGEDGVVHVLEHIVGGVALGFHFVGGVDESVAKGTNVADVALDFKLRNDVLEIQVHWIISI